MGKNKKQRNLPDRLYFVVGENEDVLRGATEIRNLRAYIRKHRAEQDAAFGIVPKKVLTYALVREEK